MIKFKKGTTYRDVITWSTAECVMVSANVVPALPLRFSCASHGIPDGWDVRFEGLRGVDAQCAFKVRVIDEDTFEVPCLNGLRFKAGESVVARYHKPVDMGGYESKLVVKSATGDVLLELSSDGAIGTPRIIIDNVAKAIVREIPASATRDAEWSFAQYEHVMLQGEDELIIDCGDFELERRV